MVVVVMRMLMVLLLQMTGQSVANVVVGDRRWPITVDAVVNVFARWTITARGLLHNCIIRVLCVAVIRNSSGSVVMAMQV